MIVQLAAPASMNARLKRYHPVTFMLLTLMFAPIVAHVPMFARLKQYILNNHQRISRLKCS
jgi:hypothetical protein